MPYSRYLTLQKIQTCCFNPNHNPMIPYSHTTNPLSVPYKKASYRFWDLRACPHADGTSGKADLRDNLAETELILVH
jgi:hypothetical protein